MTDQITAAELAEIEARAAAATPAPWGFANGTTIVRGLEVTGRGSYRCISSVAEVTDEDDRELWDEHDDHLLVDPEHDGECTRCDCCTCETCPEEQWEEANADA